MVDAFPNLGQRSVHIGIRYCDGFLCWLAANAHVHGQHLDEDRNSLAFCLGQTQPPRPIKAASTELSRSMQAKLAKLCLATRHADR